MDPPDPLPNSVVKRNSADGSVGSPHVRVGHRQAQIYESPFNERAFISLSLIEMWATSTEGFYFLIDW